MSRVLVLGGNGFIGSHLVDELSNRHHEVTVLIRHDSRSPQWSATGVDVLYGDFMNEGDLKRAVGGKQIVVHLVSTTDPASAENDPALDVRTNIASSVQMFGICVDAAVERVVFASSGGAIYGDRVETQPHAEYHLTQPISPYAIGKLAIENYLLYFARKHNLNSVSARISNPYGSRQSPTKRQGVIPIFLANLREGKPLTILGDGSMIRDYIFVNDLVEMLANLVDGNPRERVYNLGSGRGYSLLEVVEAIRSTTGLEPVLRHITQPPTFVDRVTLDVSRYESEFGSPRLTSLVTGIDQLWQDMS